MESDIPHGSKDERMHAAMARFYFNRIFGRVEPLADEAEEEAENSVSDFVSPLGKDVIRALLRKEARGFDRTLLLTLLYELEPLSAAERIGLEERISRAPEPFRRSLTVIDLLHALPHPMVVARLPEQTAKKHLAVVLELNGRGVELALADPLILQRAVSDVRSSLRRPVYSIYVASEKQMKNIFKEAYSNW